MAMQIALHTWWNGYHNDSEGLSSMSLRGHRDLQIAVLWVSWSQVSCETLKECKKLPKRS
jgi:hypothetical protein